MSDEHGCPGDCGAKVPRHMLACRPCWFRLPADLRTAVTAAYRHRRSSPTAYREALAGALQWFRANPKGERQ